MQAPKLRSRPTALVALAALLASLASPEAADARGKRAAKKAAKAAAKRAEIDATAKATLSRLLASSEVARTLHEKAVGHAVFDSTKVSLGVTGGGGNGVLVDGETGRRVYMRMATGGLNVGLGAQKYQIVFLFETWDTFTRFRDRGWSADASANAVAAKEGANTEATLQKGLAVFQLTEAGLMLQADIAGTKFWAADTLNER